MKLIYSAYRTYKSTMHPEIVKKLQILLAVNECLIHDEDNRNKSC